MANLSDADRRRVWTALMRYAPFGSASGVTKSDLRTAVNAADTWSDEAQSSYVSSLPEPFRSASNADQKVLLLIAVLLMRWDWSRGALDFMRRIFGEVD